MLQTWSHTHINTSEVRITTVEFCTQTEIWAECAVEDRLLRSMSGAWCLTSWGNRTSSKWPSRITSPGLPALSSRSLPHIAVPVLFCSICPVMGPTLSAGPSKLFMELGGILTTRHTNIFIFSIISLTAHSHVLFANKFLLSLNAASPAVLVSEVIVFVALLRYNRYVTNRTFKVSNFISLYVCP